MVKFQEDKAKLNEKVYEDTERILKAMDLDAVLEDPKGYLTALGNTFMEIHKDEFLEAFDMGQKFGKDML